MKVAIAVVLGVFLLCSCDAERVYEKNNDFEGSVWRKDSVQNFVFNIENKEQSYNLLLNVRNNVAFKNRNIYIKYVLRNGEDQVIEEKLQSFDLFEPKTGQPYGSSVIGDVFDHQLLLEKNYRFKSAGEFTMSYQHYMRVDTLQNIASVGVRVEKSIKQGQ